MGLQSIDLAQRVAQAAIERKGQDVVIIDVRGRSSYTDFLVIASGTSDRHVQAVADFIAQAVRDADEVPLSSEGLSGGQWALIDYGNVVAHVFHPFTRQLYDLEQLWGQAPRVAVAAELAPPTSAPLGNGSTPFAQGLLR